MIRAITENGKSSFMEVLVEYGINSPQSNTYHGSLISAAHEGQADVVETLLKQEKEQHRLALEGAITNGHVNVVKVTTVIACLQQRMEEVTP